MSLTPEARLSIIQTEKANVKNLLRDDLQKVRDRYADVLKALNEREKYLKGLIHVPPPESKN